MNERTGNSIPVDLIARGLSGEASAEELQELDIWINDNEDNRDLFNSYATLWEKTGELEQIAEINLDQEWEKFSKQTVINKPVRKLQARFIVIRLAAAIFAGLILGYSGFLIYRTTQFERITAEAEVQEVILPDGSLITLNAGTQVKYPKHFRDDSRNINLEGEAYFDIISDPRRPFAVEAGNIIVRVLGTSFNVDASENNDLVTVIVDEGKVAIFEKSGIELSGELIKGDKAVVNTKAGTVLRSLNENPNFNSYKTKRIIFNNSDLEQVIATISKVYNVNILVESPEIYNKRITVMFDNKDLDYVLRTVEATLDLDIEISGREITIK